MLFQKTYPGGPDARRLAIQLHHMTEAWRSQFAAKMLALPPGAKPLHLDCPPDLKPPCIYYGHVRYISYYDIEGDCFLGRLDFAYELPDVED